MNANRETTAAASLKRLRTVAMSAGLACFALHSGAFAAEENTEDDASEIAARAVSSALAANPEGNDSDLAAGAYDAIVRDLLLKIEAIEKEHGHVSRELDAPLFELGKLYASQEQCQNAIPLLRQTILLRQRLDGVMTLRQLPPYEPLLECFVELDMLADLERAQEQMLLVNEKAYGKDDLKMLPALAHAGAWYEQTGQYESAREVYSRGKRIAEKVGGAQSVLTVEPLQALARTFQLQMQYEPEAWRGRALYAQGQRLLEQAGKIVRTSAEANATLRIETLLALGDSYQMSGAIRDAAKVYKEVWQAAVASGGSTVNVLSWPQPILYRAAVGVALRRAPAGREKMRHHWIEFEFTVTPFGGVENVVSKSATAPRELQAGIAENLRRTHYRPRFADGEAVATPGVRIRQGVWESR